MPAWRGGRRFVPATEVDHVIPVRLAPDRLFDKDNLQPLCVRCHSHKGLREYNMLCIDYARGVVYSIGDPPME